MLLDGILNPDINEIVSRFRHTNLLAIVDRGFPYWPRVSTVDISLVDDVPTVMQVFDAIRRQCSIGSIIMAEEFLQQNGDGGLERLQGSTYGIPVRFEPHVELKKLVPDAVGLIRTGDSMPYANMILESA